MSALRRLLAPVVELRDSETGTALLMFAYSFLAMTAYNIIQPITRSRFISSLGADNLPYVLLVSVFIVGFIMQGYSRLGGLLPGKWVVPSTQGAMVLLLVGFWVGAGWGWVSVDVGFYLFGQIYGILLISQFWTLANIIFDPRQAKRVFGFIGGGASLGGVAGGSITALLTETVGNANLMLVSAGVLALCGLVVTLIVRNTRNEDLSGVEQAGKEEGVSGGEALQLLRRSPHLQIIAAVIAMTSIGAGLIDQQLSMATEAAKGRESTDAMTEVLANVQVYTSVIGFVIQVWLTSRIQRFLGIGFALMILPVGLGSTALLILVSAQLWAPMFARVFDKSIRYTVDKTSREILFLPLPADIKAKAKPFVDVTVDRFGRAANALILLVLIKPWGLNLSWPQISYASLAVMVVWIALAARARRGYTAAFRQSLDVQQVAPQDLRLAVADLSTVETLVEELASPDPRHVLYAIDLLESFDKRQLVTPLLLHHEAQEVRARALLAVEGARPEVQARWAAAVEGTLRDDHPEVRAAAVRALAAIRGEQAVGLMRPYLDDRDPRIAITAAVALAGSPDPADVDAAERTLRAFADETGQAAAPARREVAQALAHVQAPRFRHLLVSLMYDPSAEVAQEAIRSVGRLGAPDSLFIPPLLTLLRNRLLKGAARQVLVSYGEQIVDPLAYFLHDRDEDIWVRRHIPLTLASITTQASADALLTVLDDPDGFLRYKAIRALGRLRRANPAIRVPADRVEQLIVRETNRYFSYLGLHYNLAHNDPVARNTLLARSLTEKLTRTVDRVYRLLALIYPHTDVAAARWTLENGEPRARAGALEYLDNLLTGTVRKRVMPVLEDLPLGEKVRRGNVLLKTRIRDAEDSLAQLVHDEDQVVAAAAIHFVEERGIWSLADDLEYALAHRTPRDWYVFEAASWALAAHRMDAAARRARWMEPLPAVELADRLRRMPLFDFVSVDELFRIAGVGRQVRHEHGRLVIEQAAPVEDVQFLLDGVVTAARADGGIERIQAPAPVGFFEVLEGVPGRATVRAEEPAICLALRSEQWLGLLSENTELAQGLFRLVLEREGAQAWRGVVPGVLRQHAVTPTGGPLQPIEKLLLVEEMPVFARASADDVAALAALTREAPLVPGDLLFREGDPPALYIVIAGELSLEPVAGGEPRFAGPGDTVGVFETLSGAETTGWRAHVTRPGLALRVEREAFFDLLADRIGLLQGVFLAIHRRAARDAADAGRVTV
jgi:ATP:ADP antiporter, AAA family